MLADIELRVSGRQGLKGVHQHPPPRAPLLWVTHALRGEVEDRWHVGTLLLDTVLGGKDCASPSRDGRSFKTPPGFGTDLMIGTPLSG